MAQKPPIEYSTTTESTVFTDLQNYIDAESLLKSEIVVVCGG